MKKPLLYILVVSFLLAARIVQSAEESPQRITLRSSYSNLSVSEVYSMPNIYIRKFDEWGFYGHSTIIHNYEKKSIKGGDVVIDHTTGLMWLQSGSKEYMQWNVANGWVRKLNSLKFAGYNDWRLPTIEEAASLLEPGKTNALHIDPIFDKEQWGIWSGDKRGGSTWSVYFSLGNVRWRYKNRYVRPVRSLN
ncbi:MAG: DUF1566 domain-containing protein [Candidatus Scalindua sp.]|jgi:hypothetical protein|nr:DUF1566 domain-containing protein [Candidatus Scalindua sp.]MBT5306905.1 DUF1566 domain-containing protein [Candidatus Scalindua sp.]MBT6564843.1 DUF1566 domain-containing protein [Candidatus Scalindua sp.]MBT7213469.1 DUF1566 domain-containing protein [Candidatus Scalindua sp.]MBT7591840.1 DUF1566 domain-containing protein [Candidatus Scalindua sp.]